MAGAWGAEPEQSLERSGFCAVSARDMQTGSGIDWQRLAEYPELSKLRCGQTLVRLHLSGATSEQEPCSC